MSDEALWLWERLQDFERNGSTAAASLDAVCAISRIVAYNCWKYNVSEVSKIFETSIGVATSMWGKVRQESGIGMFMPIVTNLASFQRCRL